MVRLGKRARAEKGGGKKVQQFFILGLFVSSLFVGVAEDEEVAAEEEEEIAGAAAGAAAGGLGRKRLTSSVTYLYRPSGKMTASTQPGAAWARISVKKLKF